MNDQSHASQWRETLRLYEAITKICEHQRPMLELVRWLANSDFAALISPATSHFTLNLQANDFLRAKSSRGFLHLTYHENFAVEYQQQEADGGLATLKREYAADEIRAVIEAWVYRLQMEAQI